MWKLAGLVTFVALALLALPYTASADVGTTYLGAFRAFPGTPNVYGGDLTLYPAGNGGAGSLFLSAGWTGGGKEVYELTMPALVITSSVGSLNTATTLRSFDTSTAPVGLVWRSTDDRLYYSTGATGSLNMSFRCINRDGTGESAVRNAQAWEVGGFGLCQIPDAWAAAHAGGKNLATVGPIRGARISGVDPWNASVSVTQFLWYYSDQNAMVGYEYPDTTDALAWVEIGTEKTVIVSSSDISAGTAKLYFLHVSDIEANTNSNPAQPYKTLSVQDRMFTTSHALFGLTYDSTNGILYGAEGEWNQPVVVHAWQCSDVPPQDDPPTSVTDLAAGNPTLTSITLTWRAPSDDRGVGNKAASYDVRYSTAAIDDTNWAAATQAAGEPTPSSPNAPESFTVTGLTPATTYYFAVKSADAAGHISGLSNVPSCMTIIPDTTPPAAATDLAAVNVQSRQLLLRWSATGDDGMTGTATSYDVRMSTSPIDAGNFAAATVIPQTLTPKAPGQMESLLVTGLTPSTTYHFAVKIADEVPNWSALSNPLSVTTLPPDAVAPAAVTDLAASGSEALSTNLSWTASGDDGNAGTATSYEIRYSTAAITEANWATATLAPNILAPQPSGAADHFTVIGLQPETTYYFALKVKDEEGNASGISNVASHTTGSIASMPLVTSLAIAEKTGAASDNYPVTLSMVFKKGDVADNVTVRAAGLVLPTQTDVKVRYDDGSVKHAMVSFVIPHLAASQTQTVDILAGGPNYNTGWVTREQLLAGDFEAAMDIIVGSTHNPVSARQILQGLVSVNYWLKGGIVSELIIRDWTVNVQNQLNVSYLVRIYPAAAAIRIDTIVENCWINARGNLTYDFTLALGKSVPQTVFSKSAFTHNQSARWHKVFWQGTTPPAVEIRYNLPYMISTGLLPRYDTSLVPTESTLAGQYSGWLASGHDIMDKGIIEPYFPTTGGRPDIGPYPQWTALYLSSMDNRQREIMLNCGDLSGSIPIHFRETDPARSFYRHVISIDDRPTIWTGQPDWDGIATADRFPAAVGSLGTIWSVDLSHQPSFAYVPYLVTGDYYYLEEMYFWAGWCVGDSNYSYRQGSKGILTEITRGEAWGIRNVADAANMAPDGDVEKPYLNEKLSNNLTYWTQTYVQNGNYPTIRYWQATLASDRPDSNLAASCSHYTSPWMDDYMLIALGHIKDIGYPSHALVNWLGQSIINRFSAPGYNPYRAAPYHIPVKYWVSPGVAADYATWLDVNNAFVDPVPTDLPNPDYPNSYTYSARAALSYAKHLPGGLEAWDWLEAHIHNKNLLPTDTRWAFLPSTAPLGDANGDSHVDVVDLLYLVDTFGRVIGEVGYNAACDFNGDNSIDVVDLLCLVENFGL